jgi:hypothetical protein
MRLNILGMDNCFEVARLYGIKRVAKEIEWLKQQRSLSHVAFLLSAGFLYWVLLYKLNDRFPTD